MRVILLHRRTALLTLAGLLLGASVAVGPGADVAGQTKRPMTLIDIAELTRVADPQMSPDGRFVTYLLSHADWAASRQVWNLWRQDTAGGAPVQLTTGGPGEAFGQIVSPDAATIAIVHGGQLMLLAAAGPGNAVPRALTKHAAGVFSPAWSPDGASIYFLAADPRTADDRARAAARGDIYAEDEDYKQRHLWKVTVATGVEQQLTRGDMTDVSYRVSRDGTRVAIERSPSPLVADDQKSEVWTIDANGQNARAVTRNDFQEVEPELSPDNSQVLFLADVNAKLDRYYPTTLVVAPAAGGTPRVLIPDFPYTFDRATWAPDGKSIIAAVNMGVHSEVFRVDVAARTATALTDGQHNIPSYPAPVWSYEPKGNRLVVLFDEPTRFGDLWSVPLTSAPGATPARLTRVFDAVEQTFQMPRQEKVEWKGNDGTAVEGILIYPLDYAAGTRYPLVVQMHAGLYETDKFGSGPGLFQNYFPVLAAKGYAIFRPNFRGNPGYGSAFYRDVVGGYFKNMHLDVLAGVDALIKRGIADPNRLVIMGWSTGGHVTNKLITFTDRFKAASSGAGVANWISLFGESDTRANRSIWFGGTPWQKDAPIQLYWNGSPLKDVAKVKTPTLFFAGENDARVPLPQAEEMFHALESNGIPTHLYVAPREPHQWGELRHLLFKANVELEWFEKYAMGRSYTWETAPN